ncbi:MAG: hypothetical protein FWE59_00610 [Oscillospiraceae bacterium]|nr:hypothetical protein [Oscillospiraceae bacterium]
MRRRRGFGAAGHRAIALVELIISIGALAAVSIVVMQLFVRAASWEDRARDLDRACMEAQSVVELCRLYGEPVDPGGNWVRPLSANGEGSWEIYYDSEWHPVADKPDRGFVLSVSVSVSVAELSSASAPDATSASAQDAAPAKLRCPEVTVIRLDPAQEDTRFKTVYPPPDLSVAGVEGEGEAP